MKIRTGFVSNSSSTSFTFIFKGSKIKELFYLITKYDQYFDLYFTPYEEKKLHCTAEDVVKSMKRVKSNSDLVSIKSFHQNIESEIKLLEKRIEKVKCDRVSKEFEAKWDEEYLFEILNKKSSIEEAIEEGFEKVLIIDFGDNHGDISGGKVGYCMDYEGRSIDINKPDLIVTTEQNR